MKLTIQDGRDSFYTFDSNRILLLTATDEEQIKQVEFSTEEAGGTETWTKDVLEQEDGVKFVQVPNEFLNGDYTRLVCYAVALDSKGEFTRQKEVFRIKYRPQPEDWFLTYSERITFASIKALTEQYKSNASDSAELASKYAENNEDVAVEPGKYSAKHWSIKSNKKYEEIRSYVGSASDPESALGSIESARAKAVSDLEKQETDSIESVGTYTSNTAIPSVSQYVEGTAKPALKTYGEQQVDSYVNGTVKPELDRYVNNEKKQVLDEYTAEKKTELDTYTSVDKKKVIDDYVNNVKKVELNTYTNDKKSELDVYKTTKADELNEHTVSLKGSLDGYTTAKEQDILEFTEQKKQEVQGVYQTDLNELKGDLVDIDNVVHYIFNDLPTKGKLINWAESSISDHPNYNISDTIHVTKGTRIKGSSYYEAVWISCVSKVTEDGDFVKSMVNGSSATTLNIDYVFLEDMYIKVCIRSGGYFRLFFDVKNAIKETKNSLGTIDKKVKNIINNYDLDVIAEKPYFINVPIVKGITYRVINHTNGMINMATYSEDKSTEIQSLQTMSQNSFYSFKAISDAFFLLLNPLASGRVEIIDTSTDIEKINDSIDQLLRIGVGTDYPTIKEGFAEAVRLNKGVLISAGEYDLVAEGIDGIGYILPKKVIGYGAILRCDLPEENWSLSPLNCDYTSPLDVEVYGLTVICSNCRYNIHDDMGAMTRGRYYKHIFKDLTLIHNSAPSSVLIHPNNIGGGFGDMGEILIENCIMESQSDINSDYHSSFAEVQTKGCKATFKDCVLNKTVTSASLGSDTSYMNKVYVTNCLCGTVPVNVTYTNNSLIGWNNVQS